MPPNFDELPKKKRAAILAQFADFDARGRRYERAMKYANQAIKIDSNNVEAYIARGIVYAHINENDKAIEDYNNALRLNPKSKYALRRRADSYIVSGQFDLAILDLERISEVGPYADNWEDRLARLAWLYATCHDSRYLDGKKSVEIIQKFAFCAITAPHMNTLAAAYARNGQYEEAVKAQETFLIMIKSSRLTEPREVEEAESRLALYKAGQPYTEPKEKVALDYDDCHGPSFWAC
jgi:Tetratricopeptide repeat.